ncbi:MAG: glycosyltransferase family 2 protein [Candidatus Omnitrophota bacterium]
MNRVAVVVINYNGKKHLKECFLSLREQTFKEFDVFLLDNNSSDGSIDYTIESFPEVKIINMDKNYGFAEGYNKAIMQLDKNYEYVALLNNDFKTDMDWLKTLVETADEEKDVAIVGSKICFYDHPDLVNSAGIAITFIGVGFDRGYGQKDAAEFNVKKYVGGACAASCLIKRKVFEEIGGFDGDYFLLCEDTDLCWRIILRGYKIIYQPRSVGYHKVGSSIGKRETPFRVYYSQRNSLFNIVKNLGLLRLLLAVPIFGVYNILKILFYLIFLKWNNAAALIKGTVCALMDLRSLMDKRKYIQANRNISDRELERLGFISSPLESLKEYMRVTWIWLSGK